MFSGVDVSKFATVEELFAEFGVSVKDEEREFDKIGDTTWFDWLEFAEEYNIYRRDLEDMWLAHHQPDELKARRELRERRYEDYYAESTLKFVKEQTPEICLAYVDRNDQVIEYVKTRTSDLCLTGVKKE